MHARCQCRGRRPGLGAGKVAFGGDPAFDSKSELEALVTVSDDGTDVFVEFPHEFGGTVTITLEGLGESSKVIDSLGDLKKLVKLEFI